MKPEPKRGADAGAYWQAIIDQSLEYRRNHWNGDEAWKRYLALYKGKHWLLDQWDDGDLSSDNPRDRITVNLTGSVVQSIFPMIIRKRPKFLVSPTDAEHIQSAMLQQELLNYVWRRFDMQQQARRATLDSLVYGHGWLKTGFNLEVDEGDDPRNIATLTYRDYIVKEEPFIRRVSPFHLIFDPEALDADIASARWCAELIFKPRQDVLSSDIYRPSTLKKIRDGEVEPTTVMSFLKKNDEEPWKHDLQKDHLDRLVLIELWDKRSGKYYVFAHGVDEPLREEEEWPYDYLDSFPYVMVPGIPVPDEPYPIGIPKLMEDQQYELNRSRTAMFQHRRRFARKYWVLDELPIEEKQKLLNGEDGTVITVQQPNAIGAIEDAPMSPDHYNIDAIIKQDIREITGVDELMRGGNLQSRTTATEIGARANLIGMKLEDRIEAVDNAIREVGIQLLKHMKANYITDQVIKIAGPQGEQWVRFSPEDIQGEFDMEIESVSAERHDEASLRGQAIQVLEMTMNALPILQQAGMQLNISELYKWVLRHFPNSEELELAVPDVGMAAPVPPEFAESAAVAPPPAAARPSQPQPETQGALAGVGGARSQALGAALRSAGG